MVRQKAMKKATILTMMMKMIMMFLMKRKQITKQIKNIKRKKSVTISYSVSKTQQNFISKSTLNK